MRKMVVGLMCLVLIFMVAQVGSAATIYSEAPENAVGDGWSNTEMTDAADYGWVHGLWGADNSSLSRDFSLSGTQTEVTVSFRYWAISTWDTAHGDSAKLAVNNSIVWSDTVATWHLVEAPWRLYSGGQFPNNNHGYNLSRFQDISVTVAFGGTLLNVDFQGLLNQEEGDESWAVSEVRIEDNSSPVPVPGAFYLMVSGVLTLGWIRRKPY